MLPGPKIHIQQTTMLTQPPMTAPRKAEKLNKGPGSTYQLKKDQNVPTQI